MRHQLCTLLSTLLLASSATAQLDFQVRVDESSKTWSVQCELENPGARDFEYWLARWTAGAYHLADYGRFVDELQAFDAAGKALGVQRLDETHFAIAAAGHAKITLKYTARSISKSTFHDRVIDVESNRIADDYGYLNPVSLLGFVPGRQDEAYSVRFELPAGWRTATILEENAAGAFSAPSYYRMEDSPFLFSPSLRSVDLEAGGKGLTVSAHGVDAEAMPDLVDDCARLVEACAELLGGLPYEHYEFLFGIVPGSGGSGLEHSFSTLILFDSRAPLSAARGLIAHEFFHLICAERIHVEGLQRPDYTQPFETRTLWVNESITEYMSRVMLAKSGMQSLEEMLASLANRDLQMESMDSAGMIIPMTEASVRASDWEDMNALMTWSGSVYLRGSRVIFGLDMEMRRASGGETGIVDLVKHLMSEYVAKQRGFPEDGMLKIINHLAGADLGEFYEAHIEDTLPVDMHEQLGVIGYGLVNGKVQALESPSEEQLKARYSYIELEQ